MGPGKKTTDALTFSNAVEGNTTETNIFCDVIYIKYNKIGCIGFITNTTQSYTWFEMQHFIGLI